MPLTDQQVNRGNFYIALTVGAVGIIAFVWGRFDAHYTYQLANDTLEEAQRQREAQDQQFSTELKNWGEEQAAERAAREEDRKERERQEAAARAPFLAITQCCNQVAVGFESWDIPELSSEPAKPTPYVTHDLSKGVSAKWASGANARLGLVAEVQNLGPGAAAQTEVFWHPLLIEYTDGTSKEISRDSIKLHQTVREVIYEDGISDTPYTWPNLIPPNGKANINHFPDCIVTDADRKVRNVSGFIEITCLDITGKFHRFTQQFDLETVYEPKYEGDPPLVSCHFYQLNSMEGPKTHNVAKVPIPEPKPTAPPAPPAPLPANYERTMRTPAIRGATTLQRK